MMGVPFYVYHHKYYKIAEFWQALNIDFLNCIISMKLDQDRYDGEMLSIQAKN